MKDRCERWQEWEPDGVDAATDERERHLASCAECREQWSAHLALGELAAVPLPPLSRDLGPVLGRVVADLAPEGLLSPRQRFLMRVYWLMATFTGGLILAQLGPASVAWIGFWAFLAALAMAGLPALLLLRRRLSWGLMDLVVWTLR